MSESRQRLIVQLAILAIGPSIDSVARAHPPACIDKGPFVVLQNQSYGLCATADCFTYNQVVYCGCDRLHGDSISLPLAFDTNKNVCDLNEQGRSNGFRVSTFSVPQSTVFPRGTQALYTCPGPSNAGGGAAAIGSYAQCDGGLCFTATRGQVGTISGGDITCACPISTSCDPSSRGPTGYQIHGRYHSGASSSPAGGCRAEDCGMCGAGAIDPATECVANPLVHIDQGTIMPVGAPTGTAIDFACILLNGNVPDMNSCLCQCLLQDSSGKCIWSVIDQSPLKANCRAH
jgi:hypothetical protein